jgi:hypothetical protein
VSDDVTVPPPFLARERIEAAFVTVLDGLVLAPASRAGGDVTLFAGDPFL